MQCDFDVIVVGSRIAGSIVATLLGEDGHRVLIVDRAHFPSDTLSTHFFRYPTFNALQRLGVLDEVSSLAPKLVNNFNDVDGHVFVEPVESPEGPSHYLCVRRITLDEILVRRMRKESNVSFREGVLVEDLLHEDGRVIGVRWSEDGRQSQATARVIIGTDGIHSVVVKKVQPAVERSEPVRRAMYYAYYAGFESKSPPAAEFHYRGNRLVYVFPTDGGLTLLAASVPIDEFQEFRKQPEDRLRSEIERMPGIVDRLRRAERVGPVRGAGNIPGYQRLPYGNGWALAGDSEHLLDPWSGQGIDQASTHALMLVDAIHKWLREESDREEAMREYNRRRHEFSDKTFERTCLFARDFRPMTEAALKKRGFIH
ncbi:MAG TPA: NAD(P)/FAD-dependent oxidoreductase [Bacteroidota bacterium]|nr:NAD(P)/FAD-dependent oxidoreductase [Bacteroidota bacterium]